MAGEAQVRGWRGCGSPPESQETAHCPCLGGEVPPPERAGPQARSPMELEQRLPGRAPRARADARPATSPGAEARACSWLTAATLLT